jgi:hypothetical protein
MVAFAVDMGYICCVQGELQNAADAAALAGASQLSDPPYVPGNPNNAKIAAPLIDAARAEAKKFAKLNSAGRVWLDLNDYDIIVGYYNHSSGGDLKPWSWSDPLPNAVQVTVRRDKFANGAVPLFFARVLGIQSWSGVATATASFQQDKYNVTGIQGTPGTESNPLLPIAIDIRVWNDFLDSAKSPGGSVIDNFSFKPPTASLLPPTNVTPGADLIPELQDVYPNSTAPGNFGLVSLTQPGVSDSPAYSGWIRNGPTSTELATFSATALRASPSSPLSMAGGPGWKSTLVSDLQAIIGQPRTILLYSKYYDQGSGATYDVVGFAGVVVVSAQGTGSNTEITFQPANIIDPRVTTSSASDSVSEFVYPAKPLALVR